MVAKHAAPAHRVGTSASLVLAVFLVVATLAIPAPALGDTAGPVLVSFDFRPKTVNTYGGDESVTFTATATDSDGVDEIVVAFKNPSGTVQKTAYVRENATGDFVGAFTLPRYSEQGDWTLDFVRLYDKVGNRTNLDLDDMVSLSFPTVIQQLGVGDTAGPVLVSFDFTPKTVNTYGGDESVTFTARATDVPAGVEEIVVAFKSPSGTVQRTAYVRENAFGDFVGAFTLPQGSEQGDWTLDFVRLYDKASNATNLDLDDMVSRSFPTVIVNVPDADGDGVLDDVDNCVNASNPGQEDFDADGIGDVCDLDIDGDDVLNADDMCPVSTLVPPDDLKKNRFAVVDGLFVDGKGTESGFSIAGTFGCDEAQIIELLGLGKAHERFGITRSALLAFISAYGS